MNNLVRWCAAAVALALLSACAHSPSPPSYGYGSPADNPPVYRPSRHGGYPDHHPGPRAQYGRVADIEHVPARAGTTGGGALLGGVVGAVIGRQFGNSSHGRTNGTLLGAVGGAIIGNEIEKDQRGARDHVRVTIRLDRGGVVAYDYDRIGDLRVGDRVRIEGNQVWRL